MKTLAITLTLCLCGELYNLRADLGETRNLAASDAPCAAQLRERLHAWMKSVPVPIPAANPHFDGAKAFTETKEKQPWNRQPPES